MIKLESLEKISCRKSTELLSAHDKESCIVSVGTQLPQLWSLVISMRFDDNENFYLNMYMLIYICTFENTKREIFSFRQQKNLIQKLILLWKRFFFIYNYEKLIITK